MRGIERKVMVFHKDELLADIAGNCEVVAMTAQGDRHIVQDVLDDGNRELVERSMARSFSECVTLLYPYAKCLMGSHRKDNKLEDVVAYEMVLDFENLRSETKLEHLKNCIHDYIVYKAVAGWLAKSLPEANAGDWEEKAANLREQVATALVLPYAPARLRIKPHWY